jgi:transposase
MDLYIGVDTHKKQHVLVALDELGQRWGHLTIANTPAGWLDALGWARAGGQERCWGVENSGALGKGFAQFLLEQGEPEGHEVVPHRTAQYRRWGRTQDKTDETDALAMARLLLAEGARLPRVQADDASTELRLLSDQRDSLVRERTRLINQLHAQMLQIDPCYRDKSGPLTHPRGIAYCRDLALPEARAVTQTRLFIARQLAAQIASLNEQIAAVTAMLGERVRATRTPLLALSGVGEILAARLLGELGQVPRIPSAKALAALAGIAPVAVSSGGYCSYRVNRGGNRQLNRAIHVMALAQRRCDPRARAYYEKKRAEGKTPRAALRCLKRQLVDVIYRAFRQATTANLTPTGAPEVRPPLLPGASGGAAA